MRPDPATSLDSRRRAVVAALRAVRDERPTSWMQPSVEQRAEIAALQSEVRRLSDRLDRVEDTIELLQDDGEPPLTWPSPVTMDSTLEVPPLEVSRRSSPAFDVLLGPPPVDEARDSA